MLFLPIDYYDDFSALALVLKNLVFATGLRLSFFGYFNLFSYYFNYSIKPSFGSTYGL